MTTKLRALECYIMPVLTYASETWTVSTAMEKRFEAAEMWFLRIILDESHNQWRHLRSSLPNFTLIGAACRPCWAKNPKIGIGSWVTQKPAELPATDPAGNNANFSICVYCMWRRLYSRSSAIIIRNFANSFLPFILLSPSLAFRTTPSTYIRIYNCTCVVYTLWVRKTAHFLFLA